MTAIALADPVVPHETRPVRRLTLVPSGCSPQTSVRVALAGASMLVRGAFRALLEAEHDMAIAGEASCGDDAVDLAHRERPDVVVMCLDGPDSSAMDAIRRMTHGPGPSVQVVVLCSSDDGERAFALLQAGASGFLPLDTEPDELVRAVRVVSRGEAFLSPGATHTLIAELTSQSPPAGEPVSEELGELTSREREVMAHAAGGLSNHEIACRLQMSPATARTHISRAMMKLGARDRAQLVALAYRTGLVRPRSRSAAPAGPVLVHQG